MASFDILIKNGRIVDGTGSPVFKGALAVKDGRIHTIGQVEGDIAGDAKRIIDANGLTVTPGFIDVHNHGDLSILHFPEADGFVRQGMTTFVGGNCGTSPGPYGDYIDQMYFLYDLYWELDPDMYYPERLQPRDEVNRLHKEWYGWEIDWERLGEFCAKVDERGLSPNYVPIVGHGDIRNLVMGRDFRREATDDEISEMKEHVRKALEEGVRGISVGRDYAPGYYANKEELIECAKVAAEYGGIYTSHSLRTGIRIERRPGEWPPGKIHGILEAIDVAREAEISVEVSHLSPLYDVWPGGSEIMAEAAVEATLKAFDDADEEDLDVHFDLIPHTTTGGIYTAPYLASSLLPWLRAAGGREELARALEMDEFREEIKETIMSGKWYSLNPNINPNWASGPTIKVTDVEEYKDKTVAEIAEELEMGPLDALMKILRDDPNAKAMAEEGEDSGKLKHRFYKHPKTMIGIDTFAVDTSWKIESPPWYLPNENSFGGFPRYFRRTVREEGSLTMEEAVKKVTSLPATKFGLKDRGVLEAGAYADIVIMNPDTITDRGDAIHPNIYPDGIEYVIINGELVVEEEKHTGRRPGEVLYRPKS